MRRRKEQRVEKLVNLDIESEDEIPTQKNTDMDSSRNKTLRNSVLEKNIPSSSVSSDSESDFELEASDSSDEEIKGRRLKDKCTVR